MPAPQSVEELRRLLGMSTYLAKFCPSSAEITAPLRELTKKGASWVWDSKKKQSVNELKSIVASGQILKMFDPALSVKLSVDSS